MPYVTEHMELQKMKKQQKDGAKHEGRKIQGKTD